MAAVDQETIGLAARNAKFITGRDPSPESLQVRRGETLPHLLQRIVGSVKGQSHMIEEVLVQRLSEKGGIALRAFPMMTPEDAVAEGIDIDTKTIKVVVWNFEGNTYDEIADRVPGHVVDFTSDEHSHQVHMTATKLVFPIEWLAKREGPDFLGKGVAQISEGFGHTFSLWALNEIMETAAMDMDRRNSLNLKLKPDETYGWLRHHFAMVFFMQKEGSNLPRIESDMLNQLKTRGVRDANMMIVTNGTCSHLVDLPTKRHNFEGPPIQLYPRSPDLKDITMGITKGGLPIFESEAPTNAAGKMRDSMSGGYEWGEAMYSLGDTSSDATMGLGYQTKSRNILNVPDYQNVRFDELKVEKMVANCGIFDAATGLRTQHGTHILSHLIRYNRNTKRVELASKVPWLHRNDSDASMDDDECMPMDSKSAKGGKEDEHVNLYNLAYASGFHMFESMLANLVRVDPDKYDTFKEHCHGMTVKKPASSSSAYSRGGGDDDAAGCGSFADLVGKALKVKGVGGGGFKPSGKRGPGPSASSGAKSKKRRVANDCGAFAQDPYHLKVLYGGENQGLHFTDDATALPYELKDIKVEADVATCLPEPDQDAGSRKFTQFIDIVGDGAKEKYRAYLQSLENCIMTPILDKFGQVDKNSDAAVQNVMEELGSSLPRMINRWIWPTPFGTEEEQKKRVAMKQKDRKPIHHNIMRHAFQVERFRHNNSSLDGKEEEVRTELVDAFITQAGKGGMGDFWGSPNPAKPKEWIPLDLSAKNTEKPIESKASVPAAKHVESRIQSVIGRDRDVTLTPDARKPGAQTKLAELAAAFTAQVIEFPHFYDAKSVALLRKIFVKILENGRLFARFNQEYDGKVDFDDASLAQAAINSLLGAVSDFLSDEEIRQVSRDVERGGGGGGSGGSRRGASFSAYDSNLPRHKREPCRDRETVIADMKCNKLLDVSTFQWLLANNVPLPVGFICVRNVRVGAGCVMITKAGPDTAANLIMNPYSLLDLDSSHRQVHVNFKAQSVTAVRNPSNFQLQLYSVTKGQLLGGGLTFVTMDEPGLARFCSRGWEGTHGDIVVIPHPPGVRPERDIFDICGRFHEELTEFAADLPLHYPVAPILTQMLNIQHTPLLHHYSSQFFRDARVGRNTIFSVATHTIWVPSGTSDNPSYREEVIEGCGPTGFIQTSAQIAELIHGGKFQNLMAGTMPHRSVLGKF